MRSVLLAAAAAFALGLIFGCGNSDKVVMPEHPQPKPSGSAIFQAGGHSSKRFVVPTPSPATPAQPKNQ